MTDLLLSRNCKTKSLTCPGTKGQALNLATGQDGPGQPVKIRDGTRDWTGQNSLSKSRTGQARAACQNLGWDSH